MVVNNVLLMRQSLAILALLAIAPVRSVKMFLSMKAYVTVMLKTTVLDPQGKTIHGALKKMGYKGVDAVRQGKFFELNLDGGLDKNAAKAEVERIAKDVLTNPVIEEFSYRIEE
ncbi:MAG TPA: phosphoribosylformylglycinamidine synthase subunit PurS [Candidatus Angelobacter sp.]|jgi:phosphoribosylformylglycinamidine synthase